MQPEDQSQWQPANTPPPPAPEQPQRHSQHGGRLAAIVASVALVGVVVGVAADRWAVGSFNQNPFAAIPTITTGPRVGPFAAPNGATAQSAPTATSQASTDPTQQAIQQVIQRGDDEQAQALASKDPSVMQDTSTSDFYQTQAATNQDLLDNGVSDIKLINIDWGQINVNGTTATATAFETWTTTYSDGTTEQSRDRNEYTLVQQNGAWVVSDDQHPDDNVGQGAPGASQPGAPGASIPGQGNGGNPGTRPGRGTGNPGGTQPGQPTQPRVPPSRDVSANWSGYAATGGSYTAVNGTWSVPQFAPSSPAGADATWVGIGGVSSRDLIQAGTQQTVSGSGSTQYQAWVETLPQASHPVPLTVNPGDSISIAITQSPQAQDEWLVNFTNNTTGQTYQVTEHYTSSMSSAEWIEEAPSAARGRQIPLDNFGSIDFSQGATVKDGKSVSIADSGARPITMVARGTNQTAKPSSLGADGGSFTITQG